MLGYRVKSMKVNKFDLIQKIKQVEYGMSETYAEKLAQQLLEDLDPRLHENVEEWVDNQAISNVWIGNYCVNKIMEIRHDMNFLGALLALDAYAKDEQYGLQLIWRGN